MSIRLNVASKLVCQPKSYHVFTCHFRDSKADSYTTESLDPWFQETPVSRVSRQEAYEINQDQFEMKFGKQGLESLVVNENIQPRELDMIRVIVGQLNIGMAFVSHHRSQFHLMENFTQGECATIFTVHRNIVGLPMHVKRNYVLMPVIPLRDGEVLQIRKMRNLHMCTHKVPYFFGSAERMSEYSDVVSTISSSESLIIVTSTEFITGTINVVTTNKISERIATTLYENINLKLESILPAESEPLEVKDPEPASMFIGRWLRESSLEEDQSTEEYPSMEEDLSMEGLISRRKKDV
ncbi:Vitellogenin-3 [Habropoda laboriosa]|uniref:Vitellogenin-3 n=2 Tax=Habropoda laboriosa TaxID=597456 RepID=A0A0L7QMJ4_9HYME|nr:Vitellogenin-3 [Habropoda laboriosa]